MVNIKAIDFYCLAHSIAGLRPTSQAELALLWESAVINPVDGQDGYPVFLVDSKPYWRTRLYPDYKGHRKKSQDANFYNTVSYGLEMPIAKLEEPGLEADDWAGLLCHYHKTRAVDCCDTHIYLNTTDTDWLQLVDDSCNITWVNYGRHLPQVRHNQEAIDWTYKMLKVFIQSPGEVATVKHLFGDSSDNIPPRLGYDLTSLQGEGWLTHLIDSGYNVDSLLNRVEKIYGAAIANRDPVSV